MKIRTLDDRTWSRGAPAAYRWSAIDEASYCGEGCPVGEGPTEEAAILDLMEQIEDRDEGRKALEQHVRAAAC